MRIPNITHCNPQRNYISIKTENNKTSQNLQNKTKHIPTFESRNLLYDLTYTKLLPYHDFRAKNIDLGRVRDYFAMFNIPFDTYGLSINSSKVVAYCCYHASEIFRSLQYPLPTKITTVYRPPKPNEKGITYAVCAYGSSRELPLRGVGFNSYVNWADHIKNSTIESNANGHSSSYHFLLTAIHEFAHNLHFDKLFRKFGCPEIHPNYIYNPKTANIFAKFNPDFYKDNLAINNPYMKADVIKALKDTSNYGRTMFPELFAEEFSRAVLDSINPKTLRLSRQAFPIDTNNEDLNKLLHEIWEGAIGDGQGII